MTTSIGAPGERTQELLEEIKASSENYAGRVFVDERLLWYALNSGVWEQRGLAHYLHDAESELQPWPLLAISLEEFAGFFAEVECEKAQNFAEFLKVFASLAFPDEIGSALHVTLVTFFDLALAVSAKTDAKTDETFDLLVERFAKVAWALAVHIRERLAD